MNNNQQNQVILVDENDNEIGRMEKLAAHQNGATLHRAFSVFVFNSHGKLMLQRRALSKYHSGGLWTNTCCSHPRPGESTIEAAHRRLKEEMGFDCTLTEVHQFVYHATLDHGLAEHELDHILVGTYEGKPQLNPEETDEWKWISLAKLQEDIKNHPEHYTEWFKIILKEYTQFLNAKPCLG